MLLPYMDDFPLLGYSLEDTLRSGGRLQALLETLGLQRNAKNGI
jgi:hypothetical protein